MKTEKTVVVKLFGLKIYQKTVVCECPSCIEIENKKFKESLSLALQNLIQDA